MYSLVVHLPRTTSTRASIASRSGCQPSRTLSATAMITTRRSSLARPSKRSGHRSVHVDPLNSLMQQILPCSARSRHFALRQFICRSVASFVHTARRQMLNFNNFRSEFPSGARRSQGRRLTFHAMRDRTKRMRRHERCWPHCHARRRPKPFETRPPVWDSDQLTASFRVTAQLLATGGMPQLEAPAQ